MDFPKDFKIKDPWVPVTPRKPILTKRSPVSGPDWLRSGDLFASRNSSWDPTSWGQETAAAVASAIRQNQTCIHNGREVRTPVFDEHPIEKSYRTLLAQIASGRNCSQMMSAASSNQNHSLQNSSQFAASPNENNFLLNGISMPVSSASNSGNWPMGGPLVPESQYLSPTLLQNLSSVPGNNITNTVNKLVVSPVTPAKLSRSVEIIELTDDTPMSQNIQRDEFGKFQQPTEEETQLSFSTPGVPTCSVSLQLQEGEVSTISPTENSLQQEDEEENEDIDLNKTPQQKPKRKKHRPKVIREGKPAKTPKPVTPQHAKKTETPQQGKRKYVWKNKDPVLNGNPSETTPQGKRKYVWKNKDPISNENPLETPPQGKRKYVWKNKDPVSNENPSEIPSQGKRKYVWKNKDPVSNENPSETAPQGKRKYVWKNKDPVSNENPSETPTHGKRKYVWKNKDPVSNENTSETPSQGKRKYVRKNKDPVSNKNPSETPPQGKRKYVWKKKDPVSNKNPSDAAGDVVNPQIESWSKSVRRSLNFDSEGCQARDFRSGSEMVSTYNIDSQAVIAGSAAKSDMQYVPGWDSVVTQAETAKSSAKSDMQSVQVRGSRMLENSFSDRNSLDHNSSINQFNAEYLMIPQTPNPPCQPSRQEVMRTIQMQFMRTLDNMMTARRKGENMKKLARKNSYLKVVGDRDISLEAGQNQIASDNVSEALLKGTKRVRTLADDAQVSGISSLMHTYNMINCGSKRCDTSRNGNCSPEIYKKKRTNTQNEGPSAFSTFTRTSSCLKTVQAAQTTFTLADAQRFMSVIKQAVRTANDRPLQDQSPPFLNDGGNNQRASTTLTPPGHYSAMCQTSTPEKPSRFACNPDQSSPSPTTGVVNQEASTPVSSSSNNSAGCQPSTPEKPSGHTYNQDNMNIGPQARDETVLASKKLKSEGRRGRKKEQVPLTPMSSNAKQLGMENETAASTTVPSHGQESPSKFPITRKSAQSTSRKNSHLRRSSVQYCQCVNNYKESFPRCFQLGTIIPYQDPVDEIVQKLRHLNINEGEKNITAQEQNELVPYVGGVGMMVVYDAPKKRRPRPKVDLDPESDRVWRLLMGKECATSEGETGVDKEKWWEEERRVFRGRAESFIARMHLVQGDRRFSKWKGSVVDSVIGVFLTQNVSDHLSSSAFMCLAAKFPVQSSSNNHTTNVEKINIPVPSGNIITEQGKMPEKQPCDTSSVVIHETQQEDDKEMENCHESPESNTGSSTLEYLDSNNLNCHDGELGVGHESPDCGMATAVTVTSSTSGVKSEDRSLMEDVVSSQNSVVSSQSSSKCLVQAAGQGKLNSLLNFDSDDLLPGGIGNSFSTFTELLKMASRGLHEIRGHGNRSSSFEHTAVISQLRNIGIDQRLSLPIPSDYLYSAGTSINKTNSHFPSIQSDLISSSCAPSLSFNYQTSATSKFVGLQNAGVQEEGKLHNVSPDASATYKTNRIEIMGKQRSPSAENSTKYIHESCMLPVTSLGSEIRLEMNSCSQNNVVKKATHASSDRTISSGFSLSDENIAIFQGKEKVTTFQVDTSQHEAKAQAQAQAQVKNFITPQSCSRGYNNNNNQESTSEGVRGVELNLGKEASISQAEAFKNSSKAKKGNADADKKQSFDWDSLRKQACPNGAKKERNNEAMDSLDYEALRNADVNVIAYTIRERGMNNLLAERIKAFLDRLVSDHGSVDLEWLRDVPPDKAKDYLLSVRGLGLKSVECVRLLTLHHLAFPVDTNVGRIAVRLGWVPLQPLPESLQLHLLEMYPILETIQKFLWPRLCKLDQRTLYELHYQLITFGKVFCTKSKPNCNACPMRGECKHFASAFASARLALPAPEENRLVPSKIPNFPEFNHAPILKSVPHLQLEGCTHAQDVTVPRNCEHIIEEPASLETRNCEPIIEEPASPEPECIEALESAIEDAFFNDPDEIPTIKLDMEEFTQNLQSYINKNNMELQDCDMSKALVAITADAASIPMPKLKNVSRLRTEHQVYELPDSHPLLEGMDRRERDDPSPYLLAIWTPGETAQSTEPPKECCNSHDMGNLCKENTCFSCNSIREAETQVVRGTILIPCRTAMRGSFPLNGTYFQVNEVFADHDSSRQPIDVPTNWIWNLPRRTVYFGTSMPTIFKGLSTEGIQHCFWRGFVCVRGFDRTTRNPKPLYARLHFPASKTTKEKRAATEKEGEKTQT